MKFLKTFEGYGRQGSESYPYPLYHNALLEYLPTSFLFDEMENTGMDMDNDYQRFACDIDDFLNLSEENIDKMQAGFADNTFDGEGIDFLRKISEGTDDRFTKILVGGIPTPWMGGRTPERLDIHGDTLYFFGEESESNTKYLKDILEGSGYDEFDYYPGGFYRVWWD